jgi:hypothetical protein
MNIAHPDAIWLIPPVLAVAFLLWVLWNFWKDDRRLRDNRQTAQPKLIISCAEVDRRAQAAKLELRELAPSGVPRAARG